MYNHLGKIPIWEVPRQGAVGTVAASTGQATMDLLPQDRATAEVWTEAGLWMDPDMAR